MQARLTQRALARRIGVSEITVSRWERHANRPLPRQIVHIAEATGVPESFFTDAEEDDQETRIARAAETAVAALRAYVREELRGSASTRSARNGADGRRDQAQEEVA